MVQSTVTWSQVGELARNLGAKKVQVGTSDIVIAQLVATRMYTFHPWKFSLVELVSTIELSDGQQDYPAPGDIYRLTQCWVTVTNPGSVNQNINLDVVGNLTPEMNPTGLYGNGSVMYMTNSGVIRLARPIQVSTTSNPAYLNFEYQPQPQKVTSMDIPLPFPDEYVQIAVEGYLYWLYKFGDDERAGTTVKQGNSVEYTGQLAVFMALLQEMAGAESAGNVQTMFPSETIGWGTQGANTNPFWFGF
jgi:hypothetical protein